MHPSILALSIVLSNDEDFSLITSNHPQLPSHKYYNDLAVFPDLSTFLPSREDCWWEGLGASHQIYTTQIFTIHPQLPSLSQGRRLSNRRRPRSRQQMLQRRRRQCWRSWSRHRRRNRHRLRNPQRDPSKERSRFFLQNSPINLERMRMWRWQWMSQSRCVSIFSFFRLLMILEDFSAPPEAKGYRCGCPLKIFQAPHSSGCSLKIVQAPHSSGCARSYRRSRRNC